MAPLSPLQPGTLPLIAVLVGALMMLRALLVAAGTAVEMLRPVHLRGDNATGILPIVEDKARFAASCNLATRLCNIAILVAGAVLAYGLAAAESASATGLAQTGATVLVSLGTVNLLLGELVPRAWASKNPVRAAMTLRPLIHFVGFALGLPARLLVATAGMFAGKASGRATFAPGDQAEEEIKTLVESAQESGAIEVDEKELLDSVFEFTDMVAREVMTPRVKLESMPVRSDPAAVVKLIRDSGHSRIPLYEGTDDQIVGLIHAKDLLLALAENGGRPLLLRSLLRPVLFVPEGKNLHELIKEMRVEKAQMAVVQDEFGGTAGIVTVEDIVEELVGDIVDEHDREETAVVEETTGWLVEGATHLDDLNDEVGFQIESVEFDTIGGYVFGLFGRQPRGGETINSDAHRFVVVETDGRRIGKLRIEALNSDPTPAPELI